MGSYIDGHILKHLSDVFKTSVSEIALKARFVGAYVQRELGTYDQTMAWGVLPRDRGNNIGLQKLCSGARSTDEVGTIWWPGLG
jgi:hypothetical protein